MPTNSQLVPPLFSRTRLYFLFHAFSVLVADAKAIWRRGSTRWQPSASRDCPQQSVYGVRLHPNFGDRTFRFCLYGTYGRHLSDLLASQSTPFCFLDIGANQGLFTIISASNPACDQVVALEPVANTFGLLERNVALNVAQGRVQAHCAALSDRCGFAEIRKAKGHSGRARLDAGRGELETVRLVDGRWLERQIESSHDIIVKIDVEGHEEVVLQQLLESGLQGRIKTIIYENDERWIDSSSIIELLRQAGFNSFSRHGGRKHYDVIARRVS